MKILITGNNQKQSFYKILDNVYNYLSNDLNQHVSVDKKVSIQDPINDETKGAVNQILFLNLSKIFTSIICAIKNADPEPMAILIEIKSL